jgi:hypothetical protein
MSGPSSVPSATAKLATPARTTDSEKSRANCVVAVVSPQPTVGAVTSVKRVQDRIHALELVAEGVGSDDAVTPPGACSSSSYRGVVHHAGLEEGFAFVLGQVIPEAGLGTTAGVEAVDGYTLPRSISGTACCAQRKQPVTLRSMMRR